MILYHGSKSGISGSIALCHISELLRWKWDWIGQCQSLTIAALINSLSALKLGRQYVALTEKACKKIRIIDEQGISDGYRGQLKEKSERNRSKGIALADEICRKYRREGRFFDEILKAGE